MKRAKVTRQDGNSIVAPTDPSIPAYGFVSEGALREKAFRIDGANAVKAISSNDRESAARSERID